MSTKLTKLAPLAGAAAALPPLLFLGAGNAQAETFIDTSSDALGVTIFVSSGGDNPSSGSCTYTAVPVNVPPGVIPPLPAHVPFVLRENQMHNIWLPGIQTGTTWSATVDCANGTDSPPESIVY
jgi:hypothetical protein